MQWKRYKRSMDHSYTWGAFPTFELLQQAPERAMGIFFHPDFHEKEKMMELAKQQSIPVQESAKAVGRLSDKENTYVVGVFRKGSRSAQTGCHVVLDSISDMGNLGNIERSMLALGCRDLILLGNTCDPYHPKTIRASMGAHFHLRITTFESLEEYEASPIFGKRTLYLFRLDRQSKTLPQARQQALSAQEDWSLVFGNEGSGLPDAYASHGCSVMIPQTPHVDSLNLTTAAAIALYSFCEDRLVNL